MVLKSSSNENGAACHGHHGQLPHSPTHLLLLFVIAVAVIVRTGVPSKLLDDGVDRASLVILLLLRLHLIFLLIAATAVIVFSVTGVLLGGGGDGEGVLLLGGEDWEGVLLGGVVSLATLLILNPIKLALHFDQHPFALLHGAGCFFHHSLHLQSFASLRLTLLLAISICHRLEQYFSFSTNIFSE